MIKKKLRKEISVANEPWLESWARWLRMREGIVFLPKNKDLRITDMGCGPETGFWKFLASHQWPIKKYIGVDPLAREKSSEKKEIIVELVAANLPIKANSQDVVVGFAFLEHIDAPEEALKEAVRVLKSGGVAIFTTPTPRAKLLLEFLSFNLHIISEREIEEHKNYFDRRSLLKLIEPLKKQVAVHHHYFEIGLNNLLVLTKL